MCFIIENYYLFFYKSVQLTNNFRRDDYFFVDLKRSTLPTGKSKYLASKLAHFIAISNNVRSFKSV